MKVRRLGLNGTIEKYEVGKGLEDGFELFADIMTRGWVTTDMLIKIETEIGRIVCPYIETRRGRSYIGPNDCVIVDEHGAKHLCEMDKLWSHYEKIE